MKKSSSFSPSNLFALAIAGLCASTVALSGCGSTQKTSESVTQTGPGGTITTTTSTTTDISPSAAYPPGTVQPGVNGDRIEVSTPNQTVIVDPGTTSGAVNSDLPGAVNPGVADSDDVHVNMPGVHVNGNDEKVNIDLPFVHVHKDGMGNTKIRAPFVRINKHSDVDD